MQNLGQNSTNKNLNQCSNQNTMKRENTDKWGSSDKDLVSSQQADSVNKHRNVTSKPPSDNKR